MTIAAHAGSPAWRATTPNEIATSTPAIANGTPARRGGLSGPVHCDDRAHEAGVGHPQPIAGRGLEDRAGRLDRGDAAAHVAERDVLADLVAPLDVAAGADLASHRLPAHAERER